jgi:hypothetical protein
MKTVTIRYAIIPGDLSTAYECRGYHDWVRRCLAMLGWRGRMSKRRRRIVRTMCEEKMRNATQAIVSDGRKRFWPGDPGVPDEYVACAMSLDEIRIQALGRAAQGAGG